MILRCVAQSTPLTEYFWHHGTQNLSSQIPHFTCNNKITGNYGWGDNFASHLLFV